MSVLVLAAKHMGISRMTVNSKESSANGAVVPMANGLSIRSYRQPDQAAVRQLCCETGFLGNPIDPLFQDRELFADLFTKPYLDHEPGWAFVAEADGRVVGYLLGSVRPDFDRILMRCGFLTVTKMLFRLAAGRYAGHARSRRFVRWLLTAGFWEQPKHPPEAAHLHLNIQRTYRGRGVGRRLWELYEERLRSASVKRCYGAFFSHARRQPEAVYARFGFREFARCQTTLFNPEIPGDVEVVCVSKDL